MIYDVEINSAAHYPAADVPGLIVLAEQVGLRRVLERRIQQHRPARAPVRRWPRAPGRSSSARRSIIFMAAVRSPSAFSPRRCRTFPAAACCSVSVLPTRRSPPGTAAFSTAHCNARANISRSCARWPPASASSTRVRFIPPDSGSSFPGSPAHPTFPIYLAGLGPQMTNLVGKISDGVFINMATPATIREIARACATVRSKPAATRRSSRSSPRCACP